MIPDQAERLALLQAILPPIYDTPQPQGWTKRVCVDLEWNEETGALETVGVGNEEYVVQLAWQEREFDHAWLREWLMDTLRALPVVMQNADIDVRKLRANAFPLFGVANFLKLDDTMLADAVLHSEEAHDLGDLCERYGKLPAHKDLRKVAPREYNAADLVATCLVWDAIEAELEADVQAHAIYRSQSLPFLWLAIEGEEAGIRVAPETPLPLYEKLDAKRRQARLLLQAYCGWPVNINSPDDMKLVLYDLEGLPIQREKGAPGEEGKATTDKDAIAALRRYCGTEWDESEAPTLESAMEAIEEGGNVALEARFLFMGAQQAVSHYIEPCLVTEGEGAKKRIVGVRTRVYPECRQHVQASGRHSYVGPAVQQMKGDLLTLLTPDPGTCWVGHDWKQIEPRILAFEANDAVAIAVHESGQDFYNPSIRQIFPEMGAKELESIRRRFGKAFILRIHYRGKPENAGDIPGTRALNLNADGLVILSNKYLAAHPALPIYWAEIEREIERTGLVRTFMGRPRRLTSGFKNARLREGSNMPMQGGVVDIYVTTALKVKAAAPWARLVLGAHDSHWWQVPVERRFEFLALYAPIVERDFTINGQTVSFPADYKFKEAV